MRSFLMVYIHEVKKTYQLSRPCLHLICKQSSRHIFSGISGY